MSVYITRVSLHYLILCHRSPEQLLDLIKSLYRGSDTFALHVDRKAPLPLASFGQNLAAQFSNIHFMQQRLCSWGGYSLVAVTLDAMRMALDRSGDWTHCILLSEQHMPLLAAERLPTCFEASVSYVQAEPVERLYATGRADVMHRFARRYRELDGVGSFATERQPVDPEWVGQLCHGSQWVVLSRQACGYLTESESGGDLWAPFEHSLLADETAIPTLIMRGVRQGILQAQDRNATFVAFPSAGGAHDMTFTDDNFLSARDNGFAFIRKRPAVLPDKARAAWQETLSLAPEISRALDACHDAAIAPAAILAEDALRREWTHRLMDLLHVMFPELGSELIEGVEHAPRLYLRLRRATWRSDLSVCLLSQDLRHFKILVLWNKPLTGSYDELEISGHPGTVIRARVYGMFGLREIVLGQKFRYGFVDASDAPGDIAQLAYCIGQHIVACDVILPA